MTRQLTLYPHPEGRGFTVRFGKYKWKIIDIQKGLYRIGKLEYFFNGYHKK